jgi:hypothetical protein
MPSVAGAAWPRRRWYENPARKRLKLSMTVFFAGTRVYSSKRLHYPDRTADRINMGLMHDFQALNH